MQAFQILRGTSLGRVSSARQLAKHPFLHPLLGSAFPSPMLFSGSLRYPASSKRDAAFQKTILDETSATLFAQRMTAKEREILLEVLRRLDPTPSTTADTSTSTSPDPVPTRALYYLAFHQSLPFIGFGFLDNLIMILAGEYIDHTLGITLGISTMAAAALGNTISDVFGIGSAWYIEHWAVKLGASPPQLTLEQLQLPRCRVSANLGRAIGIVIGCTLGMAPLLF